MTCPLCNDTGYITVIVVDGTAKTGRGDLKPCPMKCTPFDAGTGVAGNMGLEGNENPIPYDYKGKGETMPWKDYYLGKDDE